MKHYLAQVGRGLLIGKVNGAEKVIANVTTLTDSTISLSTTMEEVRAGAGAKLYGRFSHTSGMTVSLTDAMFDLNYIALQVGSEVVNGGSVIKTETLKGSANGQFTLSETPVSLGDSCGLENIVVWCREKGCKAEDSFYSVVLATASNTVTIPEANDATKEYCVSYFVDRLKAQKVLVNANFLPAECILVLTAKLFAGDASNPETGKPVGEVTIKIPRFQLDGTFDLSLAMNSAATVALNGTALAVDAGGCEDEGVYAEIVKVLSNSDFADGLDQLVFEGFEDSAATTAELPIGTELAVFATYTNGLPVQIPAENLEFNAGDTEAVISDAGIITTAPTVAGSITATLTGTIDGKAVPTGKSATLTVTVG